MVALLFATPRSDAIRALDDDGDVFDCRTGDTWDLFFPGYFRADDPTLESNVGGRRVGTDFAASWFFNARDFDMFRRQVERSSGGRWRYSGGTDLVLVHGYMPDSGEITIDWTSVLSGGLTETGGAPTLTIAQMIERLSTDIETGAEDPIFGLNELIEKDLVKGEKNAARDIAVGALGGIAAALGKSGLGL